MTTICTDGRAIACDGQTTAGDEAIHRSCNKLRRLSDGSVVGASGAADIWPLAVEALAQSVQEGTPPTVKVKGAYSLIRLMPDGRVLYYYEGLTPAEMEAPAAIGSGRAYAVGAMKAGASPREAVKIAAESDTLTGGRIRSITVCP